MPGSSTPPRHTMLVAAAALAAMLFAACAPAGEPANLPVDTDAEFVVSVVDTLNDAGRSPALVIGPGGQPAVSYLLYAPTLREGELPAPILPDQAQPPAVMLAAFSETGWDRESVTPQNERPLEGIAPGIADGEKKAIPGVNTDLAVDSSGNYHVVWATPGGVFYAGGESGGFGQEPQQVQGGESLGASIAVAEDGTPWVAYYRLGRLRVATREGDSWTSDYVTDEDWTCDGCPPLRTAIAVAGGDPVVALADPTGGGTPLLARMEAGAWSVEGVSGADGGFGMSMDLDGDGNPHLAFYTSSGEVFHAHSIGGGSWEVTPVGGGQPAASEAAVGLGVGAWTAGIALDDSGVHYVAYFDPPTAEVLLADNAGGGFEAQSLIGGHNGRSPDVAVSGDGSQVAVSWFDEFNRDLDLAARPTGEVPIAFPPEPEPSPSVGPTTPPEPACQPEGTELEIVAQAVAFDKDCLAAPAGEPFTILFDNQDAGVPHNVGIFSADPLADPSAQTFLEGDVITGPDQIEYSVEPIEAGTYFFRCDIHPAQMIGQFVSA